jgi:hypothetical protein
MTGCKAMAVVKTFLLFIGLFLGTGIGLLLVLTITGRISRAYAVLSPAESVTINGQSVYIQTLAEQYLPEMYLTKSNYSPPLLWTFYEAVDEQTTIDLTYYFVWENEINPDPILNKAYWLFRAAYYGYPVRDIEFFEIKVNPINGLVQEILFETSPADDYYIVVSQHLRARYTLQADGGYLEVRSNKNDVEISQQAGIFPIFDGTHVQSLVQTWNHLSRLITPDDQNTTKLTPALKPLTDQDYRSYKFTRKSQGDHQTHENRLSMVVTTVASTLLLVIPAGIYLFTHRKVGRR